MAVGNGQVEPDIVADRYIRHRKPAIPHEVLETRAALASRGEDSQRRAAKRLDHTGSVDPTATRRIFAGKYVSPVVKGQAIHGDRAVDRRIHGQSDDQLF